MIKPARDQVNACPPLTMHEVVSRSRSRVAAAASSNPVRSTGISGAYKPGRVTGSVSTGTIRPAACWAKAARSSAPANAEAK